MRKVLVWQHIVLVLGCQTMYRISQDTSFQNEENIKSFFIYYFFY